MAAVASSPLTCIPSASSGGRDPIKLRYAAGALPSQRLNVALHDSGLVDTDAYFRTDNSIIASDWPSIFALQCAALAPRNFFGM